MLYLYMFGYYTYDLFFMVKWAISERAINRENDLRDEIVNPDNMDKSVEYEVDAPFAADNAYMHYVVPGGLYISNSLANPDAVHVEAKVIGLDNGVLRFIMPAYIGRSCHR